MGGLGGVPLSVWAYFFACLFSQTLVLLCPLVPLVGVLRQGDLFTIGPRSRGSCWAVLACAICAVPGFFRACWRLSALP